MSDTVDTYFRLQNKGAKLQSSVRFELLTKWATSSSIRRMASCSNVCGFDVPQSPDVLVWHEVLDDASKREIYQSIYPLKTGFDFVCAAHALTEKRQAKVG